jgi:CheY-like chemotaxis protein
MDNPGVILVVEDNPNDVQLTLAALGENRPVPEVSVVVDGGRMLDFLYRGGAYQERPAGNPRVELLDVKLPRVDG